MGIGASLITRPARQMGRAVHNVADAFAKRGSFAASNGLERLGGMVGGVAKFGLNFATAPLYIASGAVAGTVGTTAKVAGSVIKGFSKGSGIDNVVSGVGQKANGLKQKILKEAPEAAHTPQPVSGYKTNTSFIYDDVSYRKNKNGTFERRARVDGEWQDWEGITSKQYGKARSKYISDNAALEQEVANIAADVSETAAGDGAGVNLWQFVSDHPVVSTAGLLGGGYVLGEFLDED